MQEITRQFNNKTVTKNLYCFMDSDAKNYLPHGITVNEFPEKSDPDESKQIQADIYIFSSFPITNTYIFIRVCTKNNESMKKDKKIMQPFTVFLSIYI